MYRIDFNSAKSEPYSGYAEAQEAHIALSTEVDELLDSLSEPDRDLRQLSVKFAEEGAKREVSQIACETMRELARKRRKIRKFEWQLAATGVLIADEQQRSLAQSLLDYWAARQAELRDRSGQFSQLIEDRLRPMLRRPVSPRTLLPVDESLAEPISETAERVYQALPDGAARERARSLFLAIVNPYADLWETDPEVARHFLDEGVLVANGSGDAARYSLAHDSIAKHWPQLVEWMKSSRQEEIDFRLYAEVAGRWKSSGDEALFPQGENLESARAFAARDATIAEYVAAADEAAERSKARSRLVFWIVSAVVVVGLVAASSGWLKFWGEININDRKVDVLAQNKLELIEESEKTSEDAQEYVAATVNTIQENVNNPCVSSSDAVGYIWLGSFGNWQVADSKGKPIEPESIGKDTELRPRVWLNLRESMPPDDGSNEAGPPIGTASARSVATAIDDPKSVKVGVTEQYWVKVRLRTSVYIQVRISNSPGTDKLQASLVAAGLNVPPIEVLQLPGELNEVRYYYEQDKPRADQVACLANRTLPPTQRERVKVRSLANTALAGRVNNGTIELWLYPPKQAATLNPGRTPAPRGERR